jgi:hypothetical protein
MSNQINTYPLLQFIQQVKGADLAKQKDIRIDIVTAKQVTAALAEVLAKVNQDYDVLLKNLQKNTGENITVQFDGGGFSSQN